MQPFMVAHQPDLIRVLTKQKRQKDFVTDNGRHYCHHHFLIPASFFHRLFCFD